MKDSQFTFTESQIEALRQCRKDMGDKKGDPMRRLLYGEVGSGKTAVAFAASQYLKSGKQVLFLVPTESLAKQQYEAVQAYQESGIGAPAKSQIHKWTFALLTGSSKPKEVSSILSGLQSGQIGFLVATHSILFGERIRKFADLGLAVVDEQQRFGVEQRDMLSNHPNTPHILILTATPIPRTVLQTMMKRSSSSSTSSMAVGLDISSLQPRPRNEKEEEEKKDEKQRKRKKAPQKEQEQEQEQQQEQQGKRLPDTIVCGTKAFFSKHWVRINRTLRQKRKVFAVFPLIEPGDNEITKHLLDLRTGMRILRQIIPKKEKIASVHGKMKAPEKAKQLHKFRKGNAGVLCATTCIEVGLDIPDADLIVVFDAERFGVSQLHQLRGRVGRSSEHDRRGVCILVTDKTDCERVSGMKRLIDGYSLSRDDLIERGPGDITGTDQKGWQHILGETEDDGTKKRKKEPTSTDNNSKKRKRKPRKQPKNKKKKERKLNNKRRKTLKKPRGHKIH